MAGSECANLYHRVWEVLHEMQSDATLEGAMSKPPVKRHPSVPRADSYGGVLMTANGRVLLREPRDHYGNYVWTFAKGKPDPGETPEQTALRKVKEETGYDARILAPIERVFAGTTSSTAFFLMEASGEPGACSSETAAIRWATAPEAVDLISQTTTETGRERDLAVLRAAQDVFDNLPLPARPAVRKDDWKTRPMPRLRKKLTLDLGYGANAMARIGKGFLPDVMEEKWFAWFDQDVLHFHRSWTGFCIYKVQFVSERDGGRAVEAIVNRRPEQYASEGDEEDVRLIAELIDCWLVNGPTSPRQDAVVMALSATIGRGPTPPTR